MKLHHPSKRCQLPDLIDRLAHQDFCTADYRLRLIAHRCRVSLATAETIIANAGFSNGGASIVSGIGRTKLYEAIADGQLTARKYGSRTIVLRGELLRFLTSLPEVQ
jgi:hypothetical protein